MTEGIKELIPTEYQESCLLAQYCRLKGFLFSHLAQETYTPYWGVRKRNKKMGVNSGIPDFLILVNNYLVFIEMKRTKKGVVSEQQQQWIKEINEIDGRVVAMVCHGAGEAIDFINKIKPL